MNFMEGKPSWWVGRASNPVGGATRCRVGSTPISFRHDTPERAPHGRSRRSLAFRSKLGRQDRPAPIDGAGS